MHNKFLVGMTLRDTPSWVITGSFNASKNGSRNLENLIYLESKEIANSYFEEYKRILEVSEAVTINKRSKKWLVGAARAT
jgi:phosphatidylserine/phosphatidylglycerophosphate/cardiolipin synthase-like enzyme